MRENFTSSRVAFHGLKLDEKTEKILAFFLFFLFSSTIDFPLRQEKTEFDNLIRQRIYTLIYAGTSV